MAEYKKKEIQIIGKDKMELVATAMIVKKAKGVLVIAHGMAEHRKRYDRFASFLAEHKFSVLYYDHRGHGETAGSLGECGFFAEEEGWKVVVNDLKEVIHYVRGENPDLPIFLLGHSMGSLISRTFVVDFSDLVDGVILSGTPSLSSGMAKIAHFIAKQEEKRIGPKAKSVRMDHLSFGKYNKRFKPVRTEFDWLSSDELEVDKYISDPYCGFICSASFYENMLSGIIYSLKKENLEKIRKNLPLFLLSGDKDPVGGNGEGVLKIYKKYKKLGIEDLSVKLYENGRHEILNEIFYQEVFDDILNWLMQHLKEGTGRVIDA